MPAGVEFFLPCQSKKHYFCNLKQDKCLINGKTEHVRLSVQFCRRSRFFYNVEVNKIKLLPQKPRG